MNGTVNRANILGVSWMINAAFTLSVMILIVNHLANVHSFIIFATSSLIAAICSACYIIFTKKSFKVKRIYGYLLRALFGSVSMVMWFHTVKSIPVTEATSISFLTPLLNSLCAILILKESFSYKNFLSLIVGFIGAIIMLQPMFVNFNYGYFLALVTVIIWVITDLLTKIQARTDETIIQCFYISLFTFLFCLPFAISVWQNLNANEIKWLIILGLFQFFNLYSLFKAYSYANLSLIVPFDFTRLIFTAIFAYFILGETVSLNSYFGAIIILISVIYLGRNSIKS
ncbi:MAG: DMT family transporter [Alphaproteobacteria bacterium]